MNEQPTSGRQRNIKDLRKKIPYKVRQKKEAKESKKKLDKRGKT